jgi:hypothetical protein
MANMKNSITSTVLTKQTTANTANKTVTRIHKTASFIGAGIFFYFLNPLDSAECAANSSNESSSNNGNNKRNMSVDFSVDSISQLITTYAPQINELGISGVAGICVGYAFKRVSREIAFALGSIFVLLQVHIDKHIISNT